MRPSSLFWDLFGHSLGGPHTRYLAAMLLKSGVSRNNITATTFGSPLCGNAGFEGMALIGGTNYVNVGDPVVSVPRIIPPLFPYFEFSRRQINQSMQSGDSWPGKPSWVTPHWSKLYERGAQVQDQWRIARINDIYSIDAKASVQLESATAKYWGWDGYQHIDTPGLLVLPGKLGVRFAWKIETLPNGDRKIIVCFPGTETPEELFWQDFDARMIDTPVGRVHEGFWRGMPETLAFLQGVVKEMA